MSCCPDNSEPPRATATHKSSLLQVGATTIYRAGPPTARVGILAFPDIFGTDSGRTKQDADRLGALGYAVALVDVADGDYPISTEGWDMMTWLKKQDFETVLLPRIRAAVTHLHQDAKVERIASYGYCFGAWVGARLSAEATPLMQGHVSFHPAWRVERLLYGEGHIEALAERICVPQLLLSAENDEELLKQGGGVDKILQARKDASRVVDFPDVKHGWVNRGDLSDDAVKEGAKEAWELAQAFLETVTA